VTRGTGPPRFAGSVLIVDDEPEVRNFLRKILAGAGFEVFEASNGVAAIREMRTVFDLFLVDLSMPEMDGFETIHAIRRQQPNARIVAISGRFPELLRAAQYFGADAGIAKPISLDELFDVIGRLLESS